VPAGTARTSDWSRCPISSLTASSCTERPARRWSTPRRYRSAPRRSTATSKQAALPNYHRQELHCRLNGFLFSRAGPSPRALGQQKGSKRSKSMLKQSCANPEGRRPHQYDYGPHTCQRHVSWVRINVSIPVPSEKTADALFTRLCLCGAPCLFDGQTRQAGGHWFEPSTGHLDGSPVQWRFASLTSPRPPAGGRVMRLAGSIGLLLVAP